MKRILRVAAILLLLAVPALPAGAKSYWMAGADVTVQVNDDGSLLVTENLTFEFDGSFSGAYRDIPTDSGESIQVLSVADQSGFYELGGCTTLGCSSPAGLYGVEQRSGLTRIVWHHRSEDENRTFQIVYRVTGLAVAYDDVVDVNLKVWGDQWPIGLERLAARMQLPAGASQGDVLVWGHPLGVDGSTSLGEDGVSPSLEAFSVPAEQWVELRVAFPTDLLGSTDGATRVNGDGLEAILEEEALFADEEAAAASARRTGLIAGGALAIAIVAGLGGSVYWFYGREPRVVYDREYEQEPPGDLTPAEVGALLSQGAVSEREFTATLASVLGLDLPSFRQQPIEVRLHNSDC